MSSSSSPCAACKFLRRKCTQGCVFAPYFPPDQPHKFAHVHRVFGASNVAKLLNELPPAQREDAVNSLAYEAEARLRDPVYGCVRYISVLQTKLKEVQHDLNAAKRELAAYIGPVAMGPYFQPHQTPHSLVGYASNSQSGLGMAPYGGMPPNMGLGLGTTMMQQQQQQHQQQQQLLEVQQQALMAVAREHELIRRHYDQQHRFNSVFDAREQQQQQQQQQEAGFVPELVLLPSQTRMDNQIHLHHHQQQQQQFEEQQQQQQQFEEQQQQQQQQQHNRSGSDEVRSGGAGPSS